MVNEFNVTYAVYLLRLHKFRSPGGVTLDAIWSIS